ncbi:uncharacterized protein BX664DRAFT_294098 [Halteromyces radiatus]|uniref:uncharacterized protein n=1 Tax=Halteromyces radiatus TaxID=101107 RepID=UPI00221FCF90|nr:uncharacterized protein BX664DRAFT_294098 [Halteromyces radiatus]KAI8092794.1 hypothetical protein BX664DRAFT_294098 [Halteromyces radiatus]
MSSLADELAADLDFSDSGDEQTSDHEELEQAQHYDDEMDVDQNNIDTSNSRDSKQQEQQPSTDNSIEDPHNIRKVCKFLYSKQVQHVLSRIDYFESQDKDTTPRVTGSSEEDEEYRLIIQANSMTAEIDNEMQTIHKFIRDHYATKFPELESLVLNPLDYARTVKKIGNEADITNIDLRNILPSATIMVVTVTATTTNGRLLTDEEWKRTEEACDMALALDDARKKIINYVASRMTIIAPNLSHVVGSATAAQLLSAAGGLREFCKIPGCNVQVLGNNRKVAMGFSVATANPHGGGFIAQSPLVLSMPQDLRRKATKIISGKAALAGRIDQSRASTSGELGRKMREDIDQKLEKLQEPPPSKNVKALPVPDEGPKKRRGGKRVRRQKEAYAMTELRAARNRMTFGEQEEEVGYGDETEGLGMAAKQIGKIRASAADQRNKVKAPKLKSYNNTTSGLQTSGLASSLSFTPVQGIELIDPTAAAERTKKANEKYFGDGAFSIVRK